MRELGVSDAALRKMVATSDDLAGVIRGIDNGDAIQGSNGGTVNGDLGAAAEKTMGYFKEAVGIYARCLEAYSKTTKEATEDFASTNQANASSFFSTQQKLA